MTQGFLNLVGSSKSATIVNVSSCASIGTHPGVSSYALSKMLLAPLQSYVAAENSNIMAVTLDPGFADTDMLPDTYKHIYQTSFELIGAAAVWLTTEEASFMNGRFLNVNWDVEELLERKEEIVKENKLVFGFVGKLGTPV